ncbi:MAG: cation-translocating P-type ATPase [Chloroflexi bacterium]|nr:MAG: cation-translocating P-type ATPase [Chloroflexota bacterium]
MVNRAPIPCVLCGLPTAHPLTDEMGRAFCCPACLEVDRLLQADSGSRIADCENIPRSEIQNPKSEITLSVGGLWCTSCAWLIEETLRRTPGVQDVTVSFVRREAQVAFDPEQTNSHRLLRRIRHLGYRAWLPGDTPYDEEEGLLNRLLIGGVLAMHVMLISLMLYAREWLGWASPDTAWLAHFFQIMLLVASLPVVLLLGLPILRAGMASLLRGRPNMHTLIALGAFSAFGLSVRNLWLGLDRVYFDTASMLLFLVTIGHWLEVQAHKAGNQAVERLWERIPQEATWITPDGERVVPADQVPPGARVRVRPGERFPVDGIVAAGEGDVDESLLTGEPTPVSRQPEDRVLAGTISLDGAFEIITTAVGAETVAGRIGRLLHQALWSQAPVERLADRLAALMVPAAVLIAGGTFAVWSLRAGPEVALLHALSVLLIACPCALGLATPLTLWLALGRGAEAGVVLRSNSALERLARVRHVFFDKTGTLSRQPFRLQAVASNGMGQEAFLSCVAAVEVPSEHPLGQAIVAAAREQNLTLPAVVDFRALPGRGVSGKVAMRQYTALNSTVAEARPGVITRPEGVLLVVGNRRLMATHGLALPAELAATAQTWQQEGLCVVYAGWEGRVVGLVGLGEEVRPEAPQVLHRLQEMGLQVAVLTGDDEAAGERWQQWLGVPVYAGQRPEDKVARLQKAAGPVAMVGDGINDGPALAAATVGIALSQGTDLARAAADVVLLGSDLRLVPWVISLARAAMHRVHQNLAWAFVYNLIGLGLAVTGHLQPVLAAAAMVASSLIVTGNAFRLRGFPMPGIG